MANRIRKIRVDRGLSQAALAVACRTSPQQIFKLETGVVRLTVDWMRRLAPALDCHWAELVEEVTIARTLPEEHVLRQFRKLRPAGQRAAMAVIDSLVAEDAVAEPDPPRRAAAGGVN
jgi:transcriptional regulator with XRE-family HTH domain